MPDRICANCKHWKRSIKGQKHGWCRAWQPWDYHQKRGRGSSKFIGYGHGGVVSDEDQWCGRFDAKRADGGKDANNTAGNDGGNKED